MAHAQLHIICGNCGTYLTPDIAEFMIWPAEEPDPDSGEVLTAGVSISCRSVQNYTRKKHTER